MTAAVDGEQHADRVGPRRSPLGVALIGVFRAWQIARAGTLSPCRFVPTCSGYAIEAVEVHGGVRGGALAARRLLRCHPWGRYGYDPVPEPRSPHPPSHREVPS